MANLPSSLTSPSPAEECYSNEELKSFKDPGFPHLSLPPPTFHLNTSFSPYLSNYSYPFPPSLTNPVRWNVNSPSPSSNLGSPASSPPLTPAPSTPLSSEKNAISDEKQRRFKALFINNRNKTGSYCRSCHHHESDVEVNHNLCVEDPETCRCKNGPGCPFTSAHKKEEKNKKEEQKKSLKQIPKTPKGSALSVTRQMIESGADPSESTGPAAINSIIDAVSARSRHTTTAQLSHETLKASRGIADVITSTKRPRLSDPNPNNSLIDLTGKEGKEEETETKVTMEDLAQRMCQKYIAWFSEAPAQLSDWNKARRCLGLPSIKPEDAIKGRFNRSVSDECELLAIEFSEMEGL